MTKTALLVGCNYPNNSLENWPELRGCHNDVYAMRMMLIDVYGFKPDNIEVLTDKEGTSYEARPTGQKIKSALEHLIRQLREGDVLFFHFSGHGTRFPYPSRRDKLEEAIVPCDKNFITKMDFRKLVDLVPQRATFVFLSDSCHSGGLIDKEKEQIGPKTSLRNGTTPSGNRNSRFVPYETVLASLQTHSKSRGLDNTSNDVETVMLSMFGSNASLLFGQTTRSQLPKPLKPDQGILLSACQSDETAQEFENDEGYFGAFTAAVQVIVKEKMLPQPITIKQLVMKAGEIIPTKLILKSKHNIKKRSRPQHPCLYCSDENVGRSFLSESKSKSKSKSKFLSESKPISLLELEHQIQQSKSKSKFFSESKPVSLLELEHQIQQSKSKSKSKSLSESKPISLLEIDRLIKLERQQP